MIALSDAYPWQRLAEYHLPSATGCEDLAVEKVAMAVQPLHLADSLLTRLYTALSEAVHNRSANNDTCPAICLRVNVATHALPSQVTDIGVGNTPGWGFFLLERMAADKGGARQAVIELYLFQEHR